MFKKMITFLILISVFLTSFEVKAKKKNQLTQEDLDNALEFVKTVKKDGVEKILDKSLSYEEQVENFEKTVIDQIDFEFISRFVLGAKWRTMEDDQKKVFKKEFRDMNIYSWASKFSLYDTEVFKVGNAVKGKKNNEVFVDMDLYEEDIKTTSVKLRLKKDSYGDFKIIDIILEGVSMVLNYRNEFNGIMNTAQNEGKNGVDELIKKLTEKAKSLKEKSEKENGKK